MRFVAPGMAGRMAPGIFTYFVGKRERFPGDPWPHQLPNPSWYWMHDDACRAHERGAGHGLYRSVPVRVPTDGDVARAEAAQTLKRLRSAGASARSPATAYKPAPAPRTHQPLPPVQPDLFAGAGPARTKKVSLR